MEDIIKFYELVDEELRFQRNSRKVEFLTSIKALEQVVTPSASMLELGAGTGAYSLHFATQGHDVTALDLTPINIEKINSKKEAYPHINLTAILGNAVKLDQFESESFDIVLCLGPYYHIIDDSAREQLIAESLRVLRPGGMLAVAYINKYSIVPMLTKKLPEYMKSGTIEKVIGSGVIEAGDPDAFWTDSYYTTPDDIEKVLLQYSVIIVDHLATDGLSHTLSDEVDKLSEQQFELLCNYHYESCREKSILGISTHGLIICQKP